MRYLTGLLAAMVLTVPLIYASAYLSLVQTTSEGGAWTWWTDDPSDFTLAPHYTLGGRFAENVFYPVHLVDRWLRPDHWLVVIPFPGPPIVDPDA